MRKSFTLLATTLLLAAAPVANAQTDVSKYFINNYGFDENFHYKAGSTDNVAQEIRDIDGWTRDFTINYTITGVYEFGFAGQFNKGTIPAKGYDGKAGGGLALSTGWTQDFTLSQTITLPAGTYTLEVPTYNGFTATGGTSLLAWLPNSGTATTSKQTGYPTGEWTLDKITFTLTKTTTGKIRIGYRAADNGSDNSANLVIDYVRLTATNMAVDKSNLKTALTAANTTYGNGKGNGADALKTAIDAAQTVYDDKDATMLAVLETTYNLNQAVQTYKNNNVSPENPLDCTSYILNPSFENGFTNWTQTGMQTQGNNDFSKKSGSTYVEKWVASGSVGSASVRQTVKNLPNGVYKLTAAAQNLTQTSTNKKNDGAYIFANDQQEPVYTPNDYSVTFTNIKGEAEIGFIAENAGGNWIALDNFRLYQIGYVDNTAIIEELARLKTSAEALLDEQMNDDAKAELEKQIANAKTVIDGEKDYTASATTNLEAAIEAAKKSIAEYAELARLKAEAEPLLGNLMTNTAKAELQKQIAAAQAILDKEANYSAAVATALAAAINAANTSTAEYAALQKKIDEVLKQYDETKTGAADLLAAIQSAQATVADTDKTSADIVNETTALDKALLAFYLANAEPGTGTAPSVTETNRYVATGSTEALVRATMAGSNILERGVCWSTEHNPTVLDNRTTEFHTLNGYIFHIRNLTPATVYYVRPYVMNKTYTVAYGDEVKIVTHPKGTCVGTWNEGAPTEEANARCRNAIRETIEYFNQWTGIRGFTLTGNYGAGTQTADCSYGGWMRIGPNAGNQAIGTVIHETGHGVGVGTSSRWRDTNVHNWAWLGREANDILHFLENKYTEEVRMVGDSQHGWGENATYDWFVNGANYDKHIELQYAGGCILLYGLFIDGLCPTYSYPNGLSGYTYNFDDSKKYYLMSKDEDCGLGEGLLYARSSTAIAWKPYLQQTEEISDSAAWYIEYNAQQGYYLFKNALNGRYLTHSGTTVALKSTKSPTSTEYFQLMPDRTNVTITNETESITTHGYWFTWYDSSNKSMTAGTMGRTYGTISQSAFDYSDKATRQQWIIISEDELEEYKKIATIPTGVEAVYENGKNTDAQIVEIYNTAGVKQATMQKGVNIVKYSDGTIKKILR